MAANLKEVKESGRIPNQNQLELHQQTLSNLRARSQALEARLRNEISLVSYRQLAGRAPTETMWAFNLVALRDSRTNVRISAAAQQDSAAMKTISLVTMAFLPATFVSVSATF